MAILIDNEGMAGLNRAVSQMRDGYRDRFMAELNELITAHMLRYGADDEVKWFGLGERPLIRYEEPQSSICL